MSEPVCRQRGSIPRETSRTGYCRCAWKLVLTLPLFLTLVPQACAQILQSSLPSDMEGVGVDEHAGLQLPLDATFRDHRERPVSLRDYFDGQKPVILTLNYSNCPLLCSAQLSGLMRGLSELEWSAGQEFKFVSISIDPSEPTSRAAQTHQRYLQEYGRPGTGGGMNFLVGKQAEIRKVAEAVGFQYKYLPHRREYSHPAVFVMCTPDGRISHYIYGVEFAPQTLKLALVEAGEGKIGSAWDRVLLFCLHYDSATGRYTAAAWKLMRVAGIATLLGITGLVTFYYRQERRNLNRHHPAHLEPSNPDQSHLDVERLTNPVEAAEPAGASSPLEYSSSRD